MKNAETVFFVKKINRRKIKNISLVMRVPY